MTSRRARWALFALLFIVLVAFYAATFSSRNITDTDLNSLQTRALALHGDVDLSRYELDPRALWVTWRGARYSIYGVGVSLPVLPAYAILARMDVSDRVLQAVAAIPFVAAAVLILHRVLLRLFRPVNAVAGSIVFAFGTTMWTVAAMAFYQNAPTALFQAIGLSGLFSRGKRGAFLAGLGFGAATFMRPIAGIQLVFVGIFYLVTNRRDAFSYGLGAALPILGIVIQNRWIWGGWLTGGYSHNIAGYRGDIPEGLWGLLFGWWRGMLVYSPVLGLGFVGLVYALRRVKGWMESRLVVLGLSTIGVIILYARFTTWHAGLNQFGYRYLIDIVPFLIILGLYAVERSPVWRRVAVPLAIVSLLTMIFGAEPNEFGWDGTFFATRLVDTSLGQAWTVAVNYPLGPLLRTLGVGAIGWMLYRSSGTLSGGAGSPSKGIAATGRS